MLVSVIIPVYNEENSIQAIIKKVQSVPVHKEIIVVDDGSSDRTPQILYTISGIKLITHEKNKGKGAAIRTALKYANGDVIIIQDADLEYEPAEYLNLLAPFSEPQVSAVYGSRFRGKGEFILSSRIANIFLTFLTDALFGGKITDMETCYKVLRKNVFQTISLKANRFDIEPEITAKLLRYRYKVVEVPIHYTGRTAGKKIDWRDGIAACYTLIKWYVS